MRFVLFGLATWSFGAEMFMILADASASETFNTIGGLTGAGAASSLVVMLLYWLLYKHLPSTYKQIDDKDLAKDALVEKLTNKYTQAVEAIGVKLEVIAEKNQQIMKLVTDKCAADVEKERASSERRYGEVLTLLDRRNQQAGTWHAELIQALNDLHRSTREGIHVTRGMAQQMMNTKYLADAVASTDVPTWTKYLDGTMTSWNQAAERHFGWTQGEMVSRSVYTRFIPPERKQEEMKTLQRVFAGEQVEEYESERVCKDGRRVTLMVTTTAIRETSGKVIGAMSQARYKD